MLPKGIQYFEYVPLQHILPRGGCNCPSRWIGTCAQALRWWRAPIDSSAGFDQYDNACVSSDWELEIGLLLKIGNWPTEKQQKYRPFTTSGEVRGGVVGLLCSKFEGIDPVARDD